MREDNEGFKYPRVDYKKCIECGLCEKVCPLKHIREVNNVPYAYSCYNKDEIIRTASSSGGLFTIFAEQMIDSGGVVFGAVFDKNFNVIHNSAETIKDIHKFRGSKYVQSEIGETYKKAQSYLKSGRLVLFSGTPCQIAGLKTFLKTDYDNLFLIDIICHGVPSPRVWRKYILHRENYSNSKIIETVFRSKEEGWRNYSLSFTFNNRTKYRKNLNTDPFLKAFLKDICLRPSCYDCKFKSLHRQSDITLADFWGIENILPEMDDDKGTSLVIINSGKGERKFDEIKDKIIYKQVDINKAIEYNSSAVNSTKENPKRKMFFKDLDYLDFDKLVEKHCSDNVYIRIKRIVKAILSRIRIL